MVESEVSELKMNVGKYCSDYSMLCGQREWSLPTQDFNLYTVNYYPFV